MSGNRDQDLDSLVDEALKELGSSVGPDKGGDLTPEPPKQEASSTRYEALDRGEYTVWFGTNREPLLHGGEFVGFSARRGQQTYYGQCRVFVPKSHVIGSVGSGIFRRLFSLTDDRLKLLGTDAYKADDYWTKINTEFRRYALGERAGVVFIHGYNVSFEEAALRAAQIGFDLKIRTPMAFFSWPSKGTKAGYLADRASIDVSASAIEKFLVDFADRSGASVVHVIAHSMGNRGLLTAFNSIFQKARERLKNRFGQVILAAADVDTELFMRDYKCYTVMAIRTTLYVSARDRIVGISKWLHQSPRVGLTPPIFVALGIDTVNVTKLDLTGLGHGYIAEARDVLIDMHRLLTDGTPPDRRMLAGRTTANGLAYWEFSA